MIVAKTTMMIQILTVIDRFYLYRSQFSRCLVSPKYLSTAILFFTSIEFHFHCTISSIHVFRSYPFLMPILPSNHPLLQSYSCQEKEKMTRKTGKCNQNFKLTTTTTTPKPFIKLMFLRWTKLQNSENRPKKHCVN